MTTCFTPLTINRWKMDLPLHAPALYPAITCPCFPLPLSSFRTRPLRTDLRSGDSTLDNALHYISSRQPVVVQPQMLLHLVAIHDSPSVEIHPMIHPRQISTNRSMNDLASLRRRLRHHRRHRDPDHCHPRPLRSKIPMPSNWSHRRLRSQRPSPEPDRRLLRLVLDPFHQHLPLHHHRVCQADRPPRQVTVGEVESSRHAVKPKMPSERG